MILILLLIFNSSTLLSKPLGMFQGQQQQLVSPSLLCPTSFSFLFIFSFSVIFILWSARTEKSTSRQVLFFFWLIECLSFWSRLVYSFVYKKTKEFYGFHFLWWIQVCAYTICQYGQILIFCAIPYGWIFSPSCVWRIYFAPVWCIPCHLHIP